MIQEAIKLYNPYEDLPAGSAIWNGKRFIYRSPHHYFTPILSYAKKWIPIPLLFDIMFDFNVITTVLFFILILL